MTYLSLEDMTKKLYIKFKGVPEFTEEDAEEIMTESIKEHGFTIERGVPSNRQRLILLHAQSEAAYQIAYTTARFFNYTDAEEQVDKTQSSHNYRQLAKEIRKEYESEKDSVQGSQFRVMSRIDRPPRQNRIGRSGARWR